MTSGPGHGEAAGPARGARALPAHFQEKSPLTDTAGVPWAGRDYTVSPFPGDDGSMPAGSSPLSATMKMGWPTKRSR